MAQRSTRRGPENQKRQLRLERAIAGWTGSANSIQASGRDEGCINRPDTRKHLNLRALPSETSCIRWGVHTLPLARLQELDAR